MAPPAHTHAFHFVMLSLLAALVSARPHVARAAPPTPGLRRVMSTQGPLARPPVAAAQARSGWRAPLGGPLRVTRRFQPPATPFGPGHRGVDLAGTPGAAVVAARAGVVTYAGEIAGRGVVAVSHGALRTTYEPLDPLVHLYEPVRRGQPIGRLRPGHLGCPSTACLHWGLLRGTIYLDPLGALHLGPPRLLPLDGSGGRPPHGPQPDPGLLQSAARTRVGSDGTPGWVRSAVAGGAGAGTGTLAIVVAHRRLPRAGWRRPAA